MTNFVKTRTFYKKLPLFIKNSILHIYKKLKPLIWAFIKNSIFGNNRDPWLSNNETSSFKRSSSSRDEEPVTSCTSLPAMPYASLPSLVQAGMFQIFGTWLYHIHIYYICRSVDQQGDSDSKYIFPFDPYTESDISIPGPFCCSEAYPSSIAVGYIFRDVSP